MSRFLNKRIGAFLSIGHSGGEVLLREAGFREVYLPRQRAPSLSGPTSLVSGETYTRLLEPPLFSPNLPHGACRIAALVHMSLGRRL